MHYVAVAVLCAMLSGCGSNAPTTPTPSPAPVPVPAPVPSPPPAPVPPFTLSGRVSDASSGMPLGATSVVIIDGANLNRSTTTDADGAFQLPDLGLGGFAVRFRHDGYDSVFRGVQLSADTSVNVPMRPAMQSLAGTWTGSLTQTTSNGPPPQTMAIAELNLTHTGPDSAGIYPNTQTLFTATMRDPSAIGSTTSLTGTITLYVFTGGRNIVTCTGKGALSGTVNWSRLSATAPQVPFDCGFTYTDVTLSLVKQQ